MDTNPPPVAPLQVKTLANREQLNPPLRAAVDAGADKLRHPKEVPPHIWTARTLFLQWLGDPLAQTDGSDLSAFVAFRYSGAWSARLKALPDRGPAWPFLALDMTVFTGVHFDPVLEFAQDPARTDPWQTRAAFCQQQTAEFLYLAKAGTANAAVPRRSHRINHLLSAEASVTNEVLGYALVAPLRDLQQDRDSGRHRIGDSRLSTSKSRAVARAVARK